jgi:hypothetical protein
VVRRRGQDLSFTRSSPCARERGDTTPRRSEHSIPSPPPRISAPVQDFVAAGGRAGPHGVGAEREIEPKLTVKERFLAWEPGKRLTFTVFAIAPVVDAMEDMLLSCTARGRRALPGRPLRRSC